MQSALKDDKFLICRPFSGTYRIYPGAGGRQEESPDDSVEGRFQSGVGHRTHPGEGHRHHPDQGTHHGENLHFPPFLEAGFRH